MNEYKININGNTFILSYEEMIELLTAGIRAKEGNECFKSMQNKTRGMIEFMPISDY